MRRLPHDGAMVWNGSQIVGTSTWLTEGLDTACRMLREEADEAWGLIHRAAELAAMVARESPSAEAYRVAVDGLSNDADAAARLLEDVAASAVTLRDQALAQAAAVAGAGAGW